MSAWIFAYPPPHFLFPKVYSLPNNNLQEDIKEIIFNFRQETHEITSNLMFCYSCTFYVRPISCFPIYPIHWWQSDCGNWNYHHPNMAGVKTGKINFPYFLIFITIEGENRATMAQWSSVSRRWSINVAIFETSSVFYTNIFIISYLDKV